MDDSFHEMIVKGYKMHFEGLKTAGLVLFALVLLILAVIFSAWLGLLMPLFVLGIGYGLFYVLRGFSREFEYTVTNGDLDIDLIVAQRKRKRVFSGSSRKFDSMSPLNLSQSEGLKSASLAVIDCRGRRLKSAASEKWIHYQIVTDYQGKKVKVLLTPDEIILNQLKKFNPSRIILG